MRRILSIASQKGGVGKTTTALNLAYSLGRIVGQVVLFDLDPQSGLTHATNLRRRTSRGLADVVAGRCSPEEVRATTRDGVLTLVGMGDLTADRVPEIEAAARDGRLRAAVDAIASHDRYAVIDAPAGIGALARSALEIADGVILVVNSRAMSVRSIPAFLSLVKDVARQANPRLKLEGVLVSMFDTRSPSEGRMLDELRQTLPPDLLFRTVVPCREEVETASAACLPLALTKGAEDLARLFLDLALEVRERELTLLDALVADDEPSLF
jgi:chromosome partitioning protein